MSTFINDLNSNIEERWSDVEKLLLTAKSVEESDEHLHDVLCRSAILFISAHLESFVKDAAKAAISDVNTFSDFKSAPESMKKVYCKVFTSTNTEVHPDNKGSIGRDTEERTKLLISKLNSLAVKFEVGPFLIYNSYGNNQKNPTPNIVSKIFNNFGIKSPFKWLDNSDFTKIFEGIKSSSSQITDKALLLKSHIEQNTLNFPYSTDITLFGLQEPTSTAAPATVRSFWETFLDELLKTRHLIAHGSSMDERLSVDTVSELKITVTLFERMLILILCHKILNPSSSS